MKNIILTVLFCFVAANAFSFSMVEDLTTGSTTYSYDDTWVNWPGYTSPLLNPDGTPADENGTPKIKSMDIVIDSNNYLESVKINLKTDQYQSYDSLFISTDGAWDSWDYFVHGGGNTNSGYTSGSVATDGLYSVADSFDYTYVTTKNRIGNPNGIDAADLTLLSGQETKVFSAAYGDKAISYDFSDWGIAFDVDNFFVAYAPWCDNDIIGGGTAPVPEPATLILLGSGLAGLAFYRRKKK